MNTKNTTGMRNQGEPIESTEAKNNPYDGHFPVKFSDETEEMYQGRVAQFKSAYFNSLPNPTLAQALEALEARHDRDVASLKALFKAKATTAPTAPVSSKKVKTSDGKTKVVDADYELAEDESFV